MERSENRFQKARKEYNKHGEESAETVAKHTGLSRSLIDDLESTLDNKRGVSYLKVAKLAEYYGVSADYLLGLSDVVSADTNLRAVCEYTGLSEETITTLNNMNVFENRLLAPLDFLLSYYSDDYIQAANALFSATSCARIGKHNYPDDATFNPNIVPLLYEFSSRYGISIDDLPNIPNGSMILPSKDAAAFYIEKASKLLSNVLSEYVDEKSNYELHFEVTSDGIDKETDN